MKKQVPISTIQLRLKENGFAVEPGTIPFKCLGMENKEILEFQDVPPEIAGENAGLSRHRPA